MSTVSATTLRERASGLTVPVETTRRGACKVWVRGSMSAGVPTNLKSFNISSLTDNGVGLIGPNYTALMADANYCPFGNFVRIAVNTDTGVYNANGSITANGVNMVFIEANANIDPTSSWTFTAHGDHA